MRAPRTYCFLDTFEHIKKISTSFLPQCALGKYFAKESVQGTAIKSKDMFSGNTTVYRAGVSTPCRTAYKPLSYKTIWF